MSENQRHSAEGVAETQLFVLRFQQLCSRSATVTERILKLQLPLSRLFDESLDSGGPLDEDEVEEDSDYQALEDLGENFDLRGLLLKKEESDAASTDAGERDVFFCL